MSRPARQVLDVGYPFPTLTMTTVDHGDIRLPSYFGGRWGVLLIYRTAECDYCRRQLDTFERAQRELTANDIVTIAASTDTEEVAEQTVRERGLSFAVGHSLPLLKTSALIGAYYERRRAILQASGFVIRPSGTIATLHYSAGPLGRLVPGEVISAVTSWRAE